MATYSIPHFAKIHKNTYTNTTNLRGLLAIRKNIGQNFLLQKVEAGVDIDATIVSNRIVTDTFMRVEKWRGGQGTKKRRKHT